MEKRLNLKNIALLGRTFEEYNKMFNLNDLAKDEQILDVASGVSSFCAEANAKGFNVTATDKIYHSSPTDIEQKCKQDLELVLSQLPHLADLYVWNFFPDISALKSQREKAYKLFIEDFKEQGTARYIPIEYPATDFNDKQFTISLVSHFLFLYDDRINYDLHKKIIFELLRITSKDIRIFPLVNLKGEKSPFVDTLMHDDDFGHNNIRIEKVDYEFMKNGNEMMAIAG